MAETVTEEEREFTIDHGNGGQSVIKGRVVTTDHGETDKDGNPKISVHIAMDQSAPALPVTPGKNG